MGPKTYTKDACSVHQTSTEISCPEEVKESIGLTSHLLHKIMARVCYTRFFFISQLNIVWPLVGTKHAMKVFVLTDRNLE